MNHLFEAAGKVGILHGGSWSAQDSIVVVVIVLVVVVISRLRHSGG